MDPFIRVNREVTLSTQVGHYIMSVLKEIDACLLPDWVPLLELYFLPSFLRTVPTERGKVPVVDDGAYPMTNERGQQL